MTGEGLVAVKAAVVRADLGCYRGGLGHDGVATEGGDGAATSAKRDEWE